MDRTELLDRLREHQAAALAALERGVSAIERGPDVVQAEAPALRREMVAVLSAYQQFKHEHVFDPAIASGDPLRAALARAMKVTCIAGGEVYRAHVQRWRPDQITTDWPSFRAASRLTNNQLRRQIVGEGEGIVELIETYG
jgi:hypothetical protein